MNRSTLLTDCEGSQSPCNDQHGGSVRNIFRIAPQVSAAFITKLYRILGIEESQNFISWSPSGTQFCVHDMHQFSKDILPQYFKHNNWPSFVRQLNMYGFHKVGEVSGSHSRALIRHDSNVVYKFRHPDFQRNRQDLLHRIRRKKARLSHQTAFHYTNGFDMVKHQERQGDNNSVDNNSNNSNNSNDSHSIRYQQHQDINNDSYNNSPESSTECLGRKHENSTGFTSVEEGISVSMDQIYHIDETLERLKKKSDTAQQEIDDLRQSIMLQQNLLERFATIMNTNADFSAKESMIYAMEQLKTHAHDISIRENDDHERQLGYSNEQGDFNSPSLATNGWILANKQRRMNAIQSICNLPINTLP